MVNRLDDPEAKFKDSIIGNVEEIVNLIPVLNVTDDPRINSLKKAIEEGITWRTPSKLRKDKSSRMSASRTAQDILNTISQYAAPIKDAA
jgi:hypothetical protein